MSETARQSGVDVKLLELLVCPLTKGPLRWDAARCALVSERAKLAYPVRDGVPVMLPSEAQAFDPHDALLPPPGGVNESSGPSA